MIRVSIDVITPYMFWFKPWLDHSELAMDAGVVLGVNVANPDLRVLHQDTVVDEIEAAGGGRLRTPVIAYERTDAAGVINSVRVREAMTHPDVRLWLKCNSFRDREFNNQNYLVGRLHYKTLNSLPKFHFKETDGESSVRPVTPEMTAKIRLLPMAVIDSFAPLREAKIDWNAKRHIDVILAAIVDYGVRATDYWNAAFDEAQAASLTGFEALIDLHRREAVRQLIEIKHLRILAGMNRALPPELYHPAMLSSSIGVSPWGLGEYSYRDYETILAGAVLIKPNCDHIRTFAPDIYQPLKFYVPCAPDFSDLYEVIRSVMRNRDRSIEIARSAREALLEANAPQRIVEYFAGLFYEALGIAREAEAEKFPTVSQTRQPLLEIGKGDVGTARGKLEVRNVPVAELGVERTWVFREEMTERNSHDIRVTSRSVVRRGLYRVRCIVRAIGRRFAAIKAHHAWDDACTFHVNLENGDITRIGRQGSGFEWVGAPKVRNGADGWRAISAFVRVDRTILDHFMIVLYAGDGIDSFYYPGAGTECIEIATFDIDKVDDFT